MNAITAANVGSAAAAPDPVRKLLVFDLSYPYEKVLARGQLKPILYRDLDGFFAHVWSVHPYATLVTSDAWGPRYGTPDVYEVAPRHTLIEGKVGRFPWLKWLFPLNFLLSQIDLFLRLAALIRRERIGVIRVPSPLYSGLFGLALARFTGVPLVIRVGANHDELRRFTGKPVEARLFRSRRIERLLERFVLRRADLVAGANQDNLDFALANGARPERSTLFRYGNLIDPLHFVDPAERPIDPRVLNEFGLEGHRFLISVGRLENVGAVKHPDDIVRLLTALRTDGFDVKALWVGEGPLHSRIMELASELGVEDHFVMAGSRNQEWLAAVFPLATIHVCPHAGRALSEGAFAALPTVAYDVDWQRELIETGKTGVLVPYRDLRGLIAATKRLLDRPAEAAALGRALREKALEMLDPEKLNEHERNEYARLLARQRKRHA